MSSVVIKTIKGRQYRYLQRSYRDGRRVRTESIYVGPVDGGRRKGLLRRVGELIEANRAEPGTRLMNQMIDESQKQAAAREAAAKHSEDAFYARMHDLYGMTKPGANPAPVEKALSPTATSTAAVASPAAPAATESPSAVEGPSAAEAAPSE
jgi:hypothetical protein